mgnify:FL=1
MIHKGLLVILALWMIGVSVSLAQDEERNLRRVCMVLNVGFVDDGGFNQSSWEGLMAIADDYDLTLGETVIYIPSNTELEGADWYPNLQSCAEGFDIVVAVGFQLAEVTAQIALEYPDKYFVGVDHDV